MANDTEYGLAGGVFTRDISRALRMISEIRAGISGSAVLKNFRRSSRLI